MHPLHPKLLKLLTQHPKPLGSAFIRTALELTKSQVSYLLRSAEQNGQIVRIGQSKNTHYLATTDQPIPLYQIDEHGKDSEIAQLIPTMPRGSYVIKTNTKPVPFWLMGENTLGYFHDLPYFLDDLRPQGFLGRRLARQLAQTGKDYPSDPRHWTRKHILEYLQQATDFSGNLLLGQTARQHFEQKLSAPQLISPTDYPTQANAELSGTSTSSSAAGEQPKFTAFTENGHSIIKFSCLDTIAGQRWADLLIAEHIALQCLARLKLDTANTRLYKIDNYLFLESIRFDRHGTHGRSPLLSGTAVDAEFVGTGTTWLKTAEGLFRQKLITETDYQAVLIAHCFGRWIGNTDMHLGNISWIPEETKFRLAPFYDMTPMLYAPLENNLPLPQLPHPLRTPMASETHPEVIAVAQQFWQQLVERTDISTTFKTICCDILKHWLI